MISERLKAICAYLSPQDNIIDIGCDHAYVSIEMKKRGCKKVLATDIHEGAIKIAKRNIEESNLDIEARLSDGLTSIDTKAYDTLVIAGMGASTIEHILSHSEKLKSIKKIILQSNNDLKKLRFFLQHINYFIEDECVIEDMGHFYTIMKCQRGAKELSEIELEFGIYKKENQKYYQITKDYYESILKNIPKNQEKKQEDIERKIHFLKIYLSKEKRQDC